MAGAQQPDGYLNTCFTVKEPGRRWKNLREAHELYCAGHLIEAGVAVYQLPMRAERVRANPHVRAMARRRYSGGAVVYCLEQADNGSCLHAITLPPRAVRSSTFSPDLLGGCS